MWSDNFQNMYRIIHIHFGNKLDYSVSTTVDDVLLCRTLPSSCSQFRNSRQLFKWCTNTHFMMKVITYLVEEQKLKIPLMIDYSAWQFCFSVKRLLISTYCSWRQKKSKDYFLSEKLPDITDTCHSLDSVEQREHMSMIPLNPKFSSALFPWKVNE